MEGPGDSQKAEPEPAVLDSNARILVGVKGDYAIGNLQATVRDH